MSEGNGSPLDSHAQAVREWVSEGKTNGEVADLVRVTFGISTSEAAIRRCKKRHNIKSPASVRPEGEPAKSIDGDKATLTGGDPRSERRITPAELMEQRGLDPNEWTIERCLLNEYDANAGQGKKMPLYQMKLWLVRKKQLDLIVAARIPGDYIAPTRRRSIGREKPSLWFVGGDEQAVFHHPRLHDIVCQFIEDEKPAGYCGTGDLTDQNAVSRHKANSHDRWNSPLQLDINAGGQILRDRRRANEDMRMVWMPGNHDIRIGVAVQTNLMEMHGLTAAQWDDEGEEQKALLALPSLLRLDELGIEFVDPQGEYEHAQFKISDSLAVRHGSRTGRNAALQTIDRLTHSVIIGHTHGQSMQAKTIYDIERNHRVIQAVETGALCDFNSVIADELRQRREKGQGLGYAVDPNWVNGFVTAVVWPDGRHHIETALFDGDALHWRGKRYAA